MKPVVLLVGRLPGIESRIEPVLHDMPVQWLGAHNRAEVERQLDAESAIRCVIVGGTLDDEARGEIAAVVARRRPDLSIHLKDRASGPEGMPDFTRRVVEAMVLAPAAASAA
jgi:hypothetical protein